MGMHAKKHARVRVDDKVYLHAVNMQAHNVTSKLIYTMLESSVVLSLLLCELEQHLCIAIPRIMLDPDTMSGTFKELTSF